MERSTIYPVSSLILEPIWLSWFKVDISRDFYQKDTEANKWSEEKEGYNVLRFVKCAFILTLLLPQLNCPKPPPCQ